MPISMGTTFHNGMCKPKSLMARLALSVLESTGTTKANTANGNMSQRETNAAHTVAATDANKQTYSESMSETNAAPCLKPPSKCRRVST